MILQKLVKNISFKGQADEREIKAITYDSRKVKPGTLFVAISGFNDDGHEYIYQAIKNGAIAILSNGRSPITNKIPILQVKNPRKAMSKIAAEFYGYPSKRMNVIGITGTNGKTSTTWFLAQICKYNHIPSKLIGTLGYFQNSFRVYGREGEACTDCDCDLVSTGGIKRLFQAGRSTFYCPRKQR